MYALFTSIAKINRSSVPSDLEVLFQNTVLNSSDTTLSEMSHIAVESAEENNDDIKKKESTHVKPSQLVLDPALRIYTIVMFSNWSLVTLGISSF